MVVSRFRSMIFLNPSRTLHSHISPRLRGVGLLTVRADERIDDLLAYFEHMLALDDRSSGRTTGSRNLNGKLPRSEARDVLGAL